MPNFCYNYALKEGIRILWRRLKISFMDKNLGIITTAVALIIKAVIMAGRFSGTVRKRSLRRLEAMDADTKDKEILFFKDKLYQLHMGQYLSRKESLKL